ncbi:pilin [Massilia suwonensis]|uniref:pilin n=1 Tax=Massilia suwonensis TaxID=648895 RepID=UPI0036D35583
MSSRQHRLHRTGARNGGLLDVLHELVGDYPWLVKRMAAVRALAAGREAEQPRRHLLATLLALFVPRLGVAGGAGGVVVTLAIVGILAAMAVPAYQGYTQKAAVAGAYSAGVDASAKVERYLNEQGKIPTPPCCAWSPACKASRDRPCWCSSRRWTTTSGSPGRARGRGSCRRPCRRGAIEG